MRPGKNGGQVTRGSGRREVVAGICYAALMRFFRLAASWQSFGRGPLDDRGVFHPDGALEGCKRHCLSPAIARVGGLNSASGPGECFAWGGLGWSRILRR